MPAPFRLAVAIALHDVDEAIPKAMRQLKDEGNPPKNALKKTLAGTR
jgi:hypothetical protein